MTITTLGYALLGLLAREPCSGYDLGRQMKAPVGFYWHARYSQIYPELAKLEAAGLVTFEVVAQQDLPAKKVYTITEKGREVLIAWITAPIDPPALRDELLLKTSSLWLADPHKAIDLFRAHMELHTSKLQQYEEYECNFEALGIEQSHDLSSPLFANYATLKAGLGYERMYVEWCRWIIDQLERTAQSLHPENGDTTTSTQLCEPFLTATDDTRHNS
ncbi:MAG: transcriptional regulator PadR [Ktedonobacteraceae bacterium]